MDPQQLLAYALDPGRILSAQGIDPDPWQQELLLSRAARILLNCCRGAGKSRVTSALALHTALFHRDPRGRPALRPGPPYQPRPAPGPGALSLCPPGVQRHLARHYRQFNESPPYPKELDLNAPDPAHLVVPFTPVSEIKKAVARQLAAIDFEAIARKTVQEHLERLAGRV